MQTINLRSDKKPSLKLEMPDGSDLILTRRAITVKNNAEFQEVSQALLKQYEKKEIDEMEFMFQTLEHLVDGMDRSKFDDVDVFDLKQIMEAVRNLSKPLTEPEKKSE